MPLRLVRWLRFALRHLPVLALGVLPIQASAADANLAGVPHFFQVNDSVYRGGQPTDAGWTSLAKLGVQTVVDLRHAGEHDVAAEERAVRAAGMRYVNVPMHGFATPTDEEIRAVTNVLSSGDKVFVHCKLGRDRTGTVIAAYRMQHEQWTNEKALAEAEALGLHWYEQGKKRYILAYRAGAPTPMVADSTALASEPTPPADSVGVTTIAR